MRAGRASVANAWRSGFGAEAVAVLAVGGRHRVAELHQAPVHAVVTARPSPVS